MEQSRRYLNSISPAVSELNRPVLTFCRAQGSRGGTIVVVVDFDGGVASLEWTQDEHGIDGARRGRRGRRLGLLSLILARYRRARAELRTADGHFKRSSS